MSNQVGKSYVNIVWIGDTPGKDKTSTCTKGSNSYIALIIQQEIAKYISDLN